MRELEFIDGGWTGDDSDRQRQRYVTLPPRVVKLRFQLVLVPSPIVINIYENDKFIRERQDRPRLKKPGDLSERALAPTAISETIIHQVVPPRRSGFFLSRYAFRGTSTREILHTRLLLIST